MALHLLKLAVGAASFDDLRAWAERQAAEHAAAGRSAAARITTRMAPKRVDEVLDGGSLYWVIKGSLQARQRILAFEPFTDASGIGRIHIALHPELVAVRPRPSRPFQGWRYLRPADAPADWAVGEIDDAIPETMRRDLMELCLL
ncbi:DUF1489 family protein [Acuticoccus mangrovi]|uniref:DUF1489 domain-containing protein n=1 Tax=Acuticoccus mangrovi TaxID=2796142 RepID=A0A934INA1_9HYPH|nr:DUF1489 domain-containing protein [Acuticoccus mangrovi]MBJ3775730.1 DUF1489 domain-containing protein [Acuticoccus mangrovi]